MNFYLALYLTFFWSFFVTFYLMDISLVSFLAFKKWLKGRVRRAAETWQAAHDWKPLEAHKKGAMRERKTPREKLAHHLLKDGVDSQQCL